MSRANRPLGPPSSPPRDWLQPRNRTASINNQNRLAALEAIDQGAQAILGLGNTSSFHRA